MARMSTSGTGNRSRYFDTSNYDDSDSYVSAADAAFQTVMKKLKSFKPYLLKRLEIIKRSGKQFAESDTIEDIEHWLEIMNNARADTEYGMDTLNEEVHDILEHMRENPLMEACYDDVEDEMDTTDQRPELRKSNVIIDVETNREQPRSEKLNDSNGKIEVDEYSITSTIEPLSVSQPEGTVSEVVPNPHGPAVPDPAVAEGALDSAVYQRPARPAPMNAQSKDIATNPSSKGLGRGVRRVQDESTNSDRDPGGIRYDSTGAPLPSLEEQLESSSNSVYDEHNLHGGQASPLDPQDYHAAIDGNDLNYIHGMEMRPNFMGGYPPPMYAPQPGMWNFQYCQPYPSMPQHIMQQPFSYPMPMFGNGRRPHRGNSNRARGNRPIPIYQPPEGDLPPCNEQDFSCLDPEDGVIHNHEVPPASSDMGSNDLSAAAVAKRAQEYFARLRQQSNFNNRGARFPKPKSQSRGVFRRPFHRNTNPPRNGRQPISNLGNFSNTQSNETSTADVPEAEQTMDTLGPAQEETNAIKVPTPPRIGRDPTQKPEAKRLSEQEAANRFRMNQAVNESESSPGKVQELKKKLAKQGFHKLGSKKPDFVEAEELNFDLPSSVSPANPNEIPKKQTPPSSAKKRGRSRSLGPTPKKSVTPGKSKTPSKSPRAKATSKSPHVKTPAKSPKISMNFPGVTSRRPTVVYSSDSEDSDSEGPSGPTRRRTRAKSMSQSPTDAPAENVHPIEPTPLDMSDEGVYQFLVKMSFDPVQIQMMMSDPLGYQGLKDTILAACANNTTPADETPDHIDTPGGPGSEVDESNTGLAELDSNAHSLDRANTKRNTTGSTVGTYGQQLAEIEDGGSDIVSDNDVYMPPKKRKYGSSSRPGNDMPEPSKRRHISRAASVVSDFSGVAGDESDSDDDGGSVISCASHVRAKIAAKFKSNMSSTKSPFASMEEFVPPKLTANATMGKVKIEQDFVVVQTIKEEVDLP